MAVMVVAGLTPSGSITLRRSPSSGRSNASPRTGRRRKARAAARIAAARALQAEKQPEEALKRLTESAGHTDVETAKAALAAGTPIVGALVYASQREHRPLRGFLVRGEVKDHGTGRLIEGPLEPGSAVAVLDDVCSTGGSLFRAIAAAEGRGCRVVRPPSSGFCETVLIVQNRN